MFGWLTRNDGKRGATAARRLKSSRASVFSEFALVMPLVALVCSALIEIAGFWDAQVMANHAAWTVGRIVMVRGSDGLVFSSSVDKKSKTGISGTNMPSSMQALINEINAGLSGFNKFNNRGNIATLFLMSTCGIGYYGASPGKSLSDGLTKLIDAAVKAMTDGISDWVKEAVAGIKLPSFVSGGESGIAGLVSNIVGTIADKIADAVFKPIAGAIGDLLKSAIDKAIGKDGIKIDQLFGGDGEAARHARQIFGAASRIARAKSTIGKEVVTVTDMDSLSGNFMFAGKSALKRLVYPQVVDADASSDGYFVTGVHGWPANDNGLAMAHVEINWPYESGWLFPIVSGRGSVSAKPPVATGHSMVFPQPDIVNANLYSDGATGFAPGSYTNNSSVAELDALAKEMKNYLKFVKFGMRFRICAETLSLGDDAWYVNSWKRCKELKDLWGLGTGKVGGEYGHCWDALTDGKPQDALISELSGYFSSSSYHYRDYYYWDGSYHKSYHGSICYYDGNTGLGSWYNGHKYLTYLDSKYNCLSTASMPFYYSTEACKKYKEEIAIVFPGRGSLFCNDFCDKICQFARSNSVNVHNLVMWHEGQDLEAWKDLDKEVRAKAKVAEGTFGGIRRLVQSEIIDIESIEKGTANWGGSNGDPVLDPDDAEVMKDPGAAASKAREKWNSMKKRLREQLGKVDDAAETLRKQWTQYQNDARAFEKDRDMCVGEYFVEACMRMVLKEARLSVLDPPYDAFRIPEDCTTYDIGKGTRAMLASLNAYQAALEAAKDMEIAYGKLLGLKSAGEAERGGVSPEEFVDAGGGIPADLPGSIAPGSDTGSIIDKDHQEFSGGEWKWK